MRGDDSLGIEEETLAILNKAMDMGVSDVHMLPKKERYSILFRVNGQLQMVTCKDLAWGSQCISYLKFLADMDVGEKRKPQSGSATMTIAQGTVELRFSTITNFQWQESLVIRILKQETSHARSLHTIFPQDINSIEQLIRRKSGMILFSGPVGSGKTTTIYQLLQSRMHQEPLQVITMEDPVEIYEPAFLQTQVNEKAGITYDSLIKASLRHHPDVLMIGEIRDEETARMVVRGALTGHLIIATIHAKNSMGVIARLEELSISSQQLQQTLIGVVSQRLLPLYCPFCEGICHQYCCHFPSARKRASVMEVLCGDALTNYWQKQEVTYPTINDVLRKAWAYGFISEKTYQHFEVV